MKKIIAISLMLMLAMLVIGYPVLATEEAEDSRNEIDIGIAPSDYLFQIENMKPGDWAPRTITVKNNGLLDFGYVMSLRNDGEEKLFQALQLEISDSDAKLYDGKLADFDRLFVRQLGSLEAEELDITIRFPEEYGNEYQGLASQFTFTFAAEGTESTDSKERDEESVDGAVGSAGESNGGGSVLPDTATNMFTILLIGSLLLTGGIIMAIVHVVKKIKNRVLEG